MYQEEQLVRIAKRENNTKRTYLVVNEQQGKHIPVSPGKALAMFQELADCLQKNYAGETLLLIGFAETATAIGAAVAVQLGAYYMQTTRENIPGVDYIFFSESHSHATEQKLVKDDLDQIVPKVDRIIFVEDEVTTGNTILHGIEMLEQSYGFGLRFSVASILNGMDDAAKATYAKREIPCHYLVKTDHSQYAGRVASISEDGTYIAPIRELPSVACEKTVFTGCQDARRLVQGSAYQQACEQLWQQIAQFHNWQEARILVLGTEEFMYPALYVANALEQQGRQVWYHATTRSPIVVSADPGYPLHVRYQLESLYDRERKTFLYDIGNYDAVLIVTDALVPGGEDTLLQAVSWAGNKNIFLVRWK